jgi:peptidoglycan L-alanyl-D-glutamate endopeptidase CwlK
MPFTLGPKSLSRLVGVHPDLVRMVQLAITLSAVDFAVLPSVRTQAQEAEEVKEHKSTTMHSRHLPNLQGYSCAVDLGAWVGGKLTWEPVTIYASIWQAMQSAADQLQLPIEWGGAWVTFKDYDHFQLPWSSYP